MKSQNCRTFPTLTSKKALKFNVEKFNSFKNSKGESGLIQWHKSMENKIKKYETRKKKEKQARTKQRLKQMDLEIDRLQREFAMLQTEVESGEAIQILEKEKDELQKSRKEMLKTTFEKSVKIILNKKRLEEMRRASADLEDELRFFYGLFRKQDLEETEALQLMAEYKILGREIEELVAGGKQDKEKPFFLTEVIFLSIYFFYCTIKFLNLDLFV